MQNDKDEFRDLRKEPDYEGRHFKVRELGWLAKIRHTVMRTAREYLNQQGLIEVQTPVITSLTGACEDLSSLFEIPYFEKRAYLRQTSQLHLETMIYGPDTPHVYTVGTSFRREPRSDGRHLTEFGLIEVEGRDYDLTILNNIMRRLVKHILSQVAIHNATDLKHTNRTPTELLEVDFSEMTYTDAIKALKAEGYQINWGDDFRAESEQKLIAKYGPLIVTHFPEAIKFFNMKRNSDDPHVVNCCDMLLPLVGEVIGGSERLESWQLLAEKLHEPRMIKQFEKIGGNCLEFKWYLDLRRDTPLPHGGFGLGVERLVQYIINARDIKEAALYARDAKNTYP